MKNLTTTRRLCLLMVGIFALTGVTSVFAAAGDTIGNIATINYTVGGVAQTAIESSPTGNTTPGIGLGAATAFIEDRLVNFAVTTVDAALISVAPGATVQITTFSVANVGAGGFGVQSNGAVDFRLTALNRPNGTADPFGGPANDSFNLNNLQVFVENGNTLGYQPAEDTAIFIDELDPAQTATVYIIGDVPAGQANATVSVVSLVATAAESLTAVDGTGVLDTGNLGADLVANAGADNAGQIDNVFVDAAGDIAADNSSPDNAGDGVHSDSSGYIVSAALLTVTKTSAVISDPVNGAANPKSIPGAVVEYTVVIANGAGAATAQSVAITDSLNTEITAGNLAFDANGYGAGTGIRVTAPDINGGAPLALTNIVDGDAGDFTANVVTTNVGSLDAGESATVTFRVVVQ